MKSLPFLDHDPQEKGPQYLEDLATAYWFSEVLFTAVELGIFTLLDHEGRSVDELAEALHLEASGLERFLQALSSLGLAASNGKRFYNTKLASDYLVKDKENYQGTSVLWRKYLHQSWRGLKSCLEQGGRSNNFFPETDVQLAARVQKYIGAMDSVAKKKVEEILPIFENVPLRGSILDVGAGSGAVALGFIKRFTSLEAALLDLPHILEYTADLLRANELENRITFCPGNILESWPVKKESFEVVILSNLLHAYAESEARYILTKASECLTGEGFLLVHDFFTEHHPQKAALFDLNMFINTYNGMVFSQSWVREWLEREKLYVTEFIPLKSDTGVLIASKNAQNLEHLCLDSQSLLIEKIRALGFSSVNPVPVGMIHVPDWTDLRCRFGCSSYGYAHCPPNSPSPAKTRKVLKDYSRALILVGEPPTKDFQTKVLQAEKKAFQAGFHKVFAYWAGPCSLCRSCSALEGSCCNTKDARPSMEGAGIDVFETVRRAGLPLKTLNNKHDYVKYFALLLLE